MKIYKIAKHILPLRTYKCGHCDSLLDVIDVVTNPNHFFNPGQLFSCPCKKSQVWANSVRYPKALARWCDGERVEYANDPELYGFCNDKFCPKCFNPLSVLKNGQIRFDNKNISWDDISDMKEKGVDVQQMFDNGKITSVDVHGCLKCADNQSLIHQGVGSEGGEYDGQKSVARWYKSHQSMWRDKI